MYAVAILDDHPLILVALKDLLKKIIGISSIATFSNPDEFKTHLLSNKVSLAILDIRVNGRDHGYEIAKYILNNNEIETDVLVYSSYTDFYHIADCMNIGVNAYVSKDSSINEIKIAIEQIRSGHFYNSMDVQDIVIKNIKPRLDKSKSKDEHGNPTYLTQREIEILTLICSGFTEKEIAAKLFKSESTIHKHRQNIMEKLNCKKVHYLYQYAITRGLISF